MTYHVSTSVEKNLVIARRYPGDCSVDISLLYGMLNKEGSVQSNL